ncbi:MAG: hypothetical protein V1750_06585 [Acidobacteriota bacterium]
MQQHPQPTLSILDPTSRLGRELAAALKAAFPGARRRLYHTAADSEHLIAEVATEAALVPPLADPEELSGSDAVIATAPPNSTMAPALLDWLRANPSVALIDATQPGIAGEEAVHVLGAPRPTQGELRWYHVADPALFGPARFLAALASLAPEAAHFTLLQPASSLGEDAVEELAAQGAARLSGRPASRPQYLPGLLAFDLAPASEPSRQGLARQLADLHPGIECRIHVIETGSFHGHVATAQVHCAGAPTAAKLAALIRHTPGMRLPHRDEWPCASSVAGQYEVVCSGLRAEKGWIAATLAADGSLLGGPVAVSELVVAITASPLRAVAAGPQPRCRRPRAAPTGMTGCAGARETRARRRSGVPPVADR